jgi:hypothetical protein
MPSVTHLYTQTEYFSNLASLPVVDGSRKSCWAVPPTVFAYSRSGVLAVADQCSVSIETGFDPPTPVVWDANIRIRPPG